VIEHCSFSAKYSEKIVEIEATVRIKEKNVLFGLVRHSNCPKSGVDLVDTVMAEYSVSF